MERAAAAGAKAAAPGAVEWAVLGVVARAAEARAAWAVVRAETAAREVARVVMAADRDCSRHVGGADGQPLAWQVR